MSNKICTDNDRIILRLRQLAHAIAKGDRAELTMRVPADRNRDADIVLSSAAERIKKLEAAGITLVEANKELDEALEREIDKRLQLTKQVREAFVMFWKAQGCSCCEDTDASDKYGSRLAELLNIPLYDDGSGVDYYSVCKELEGSDE